MLVAIAKINRHVEAQKR